MTPKQEMLAYPHRDGLVSYLAHGFNGWASPGPVDEGTVEVCIHNLVYDAPRCTSSDAGEGVSCL